MKNIIVSGLDGYTIIGSEKKKQKKKKQLYNYNVRPYYYYFCKWQWNFPNFFFFILLLVIYILHISYRFTHDLKKKQKLKFSFKKYTLNWIDIMGRKKKTIICVQIWPNCFFFFLVYYYSLLMFLFTRLIVTHAEISEFIVKIAFYPPFFFSEIDIFFVDSFRVFLLLITWMQKKKRKHINLKKENKKTKWMSVRNCVSDMKI